ncbi:MAG: hypothetical protein ACLQU2_33370 [Candidatus Binataceae bacterium]
MSNLIAGPLAQQKGFTSGFALLAAVALLAALLLFWLEMPETAPRGYERLPEAPSGSSPNQGSV